MTKLETKVAVDVVKNLKAGVVPDVVTSVVEDVTDKVEAKMSKTKRVVKEKASEVVEQAKVLETKAEEKVAEVMDQVQDLGQEAEDKLSDTWQAASACVRDWSARTASTVLSTVETVKTATMEVAQEGATYLPRVSASVDETDHLHVTLDVRCPSVLVRLFRGSETVAETAVAS